MPPTAAIRIIDANLNRAREALRVMEEYARFALEDADLTGALKSARHKLVDAVPGTIRSALLAHRDIAGDVGRDVTASDEYDREHDVDVATAAGNRLSEALRAIEEYAKTVDHGFARTVEKLRYAGYELQRRLVHTAKARTKLAHARLYVLLTDAYCRDGWLATARAAVAGGADVIQLREKNLSDRELTERARTLSAWCRENDTLLIINDRPDIAAVSGAAGVHLGQDDVDVRDARRVLPPGAIVGVSTHTPEQATWALEACPDYLAVGPMFASATKPQNHLAGPETLSAVRAMTALPLVAIGGINGENAPTVLDTPDVCLAVCDAVIAQSDVEAAARRLRAMIDAPR